MDLPSFAVILHWFQLLLSFYNLYLQNAWPFGNLANISDASLAPAKLRVSSSYTLNVPADRAVLSLEVRREGTSQNGLAGDVQTSQDEVMDLLRPLSNGSFHTQGTRNHSQMWTQNPTAEQRAIVDISVNTLQVTGHRKQQTTLSEEPLYEASVGVTAEFRDLDALGYVVAKVIQMPHAAIKSLAWNLEDASRLQTTRKCQQGAAELLQSKVKDVATPLGFENIRAISVNEQGQSRRGNATKVGSAEWLACAADYAMEDSDATVEQFDTLHVEPKRLKFEMTLSGEFQAW